MTKTGIVKTVYAMYVGLILRINTPASRKGVKTMEALKPCPITTPIENHCCKAIENCETVSISKRHINGQDRWMWEQTQKYGRIAANEIMFCPYCGVDLSHRDEPKNKPLTLNELKELAVSEETVYSGDGTAYKLYFAPPEIRAMYDHHCIIVNAKKIANGFFLYARKPEGSENSGNAN